MPVGTTLAHQIWCDEATKFFTVCMVDSALEQVDMGRKRKAEADDDDLFGQLTIIRPIQVEMPVFRFLDDD